MLSIKEAAKHLGLSVPALYRLVELKKIEHYRLGSEGGKIRFSHAQLDAYLESCVVPVKGTTAPKPKVKREQLIQDYDHFGRLKGR